MGELLVYTDGRCDFCVWLQRRIQRWDLKHRLKFLDYNLSLDGSTPFSREELARQMHVRTWDGRWYAGYWAWLEVIRVLPRFGWLHAILRRAPFSWLGPLVYRAIAANRHKIPSWLFVGFNVPPPCERAGNPCTPRA